ncbi:helix-turn-helix domain-containing protein [Streptomyces sp. p1417]|uniref:Helix-turn-helix domain-containing protein n=1 Tax=Streptomyces typhae TaxID=2681492 RepID=A0A6L6WRX6_9ACTN|nr:helix-turn-helix domain-containing protein [Streptomyces typhae]MVO83914.1 helix-turn-helix domain-containing protein [Streptomyces typhae]
MPADPRRDTRGIVDASGLLTRVRFRRHAPAEPLRPYLEHYWLIDWDLTEPYVSHVVPHPSVNVVFQRLPGQPPFGEVAGVVLGLFRKELRGRGRVCGAQFRPGGFRTFAPGLAVAELTGRQVPVGDVWPPPVTRGKHEASPVSEAKPGAGTAEAVLGPDDEHARVAALDTFLLRHGPAPDPQADLAMELAARVRADRTLRRVGDLARQAGLSVRSLQRLFSAYVGVSPKWVILRYRIHEALERAESTAGVDWAALAASLGYADQAHLVRDFTATVGVPPTAYAAA